MTTIDGKIIGSHSALRYIIELSDGRCVEATLPKMVIRSAGCLFGPLDKGLVVEVRLCEPPKPHRIVSFEGGSAR